MIERLQNFDKHSFLWCNRYQRSAFVHYVFRQISRTGDGPLYALFALLLLWSDAKVGAVFLACGLLAFAIELPVYFITKKTIKRERPFVKLAEASCSFIPSDKFSLPSGHTAGACLMASILTVFFPGSAAYVFAWAALIGLSRVMLGVHYPSDIMAGAVLGMTSAWVSMSVLSEWIAVL